MRRNGSSVFCLAVMLAGCTVGPEYHPPETQMPQRWTELNEGGDLSTTPPASSQPASRPAPTTAPAGDLARWWRTFSDPQLTTLIEKAISSNRNLRITEARIREARAQRAIAAGALYPMVGSEISYSRQQPSKNGQLGRLAGGPAGALVGDKAVGAFELYQAGFDASWELDLFGGVRRSVESAEANTTATIEEHRDLLVSLAAEVARNYIELRGAQRRLVIAQENVTAQQSTLQLVRDRRSVGAVTDLDVTRATAQVAVSQAQIPLLTRQIHYSIHALSVLLPQDLDSLGQELLSNAPLPQAVTKIPVGLPADLLRRRPDIRRAERTLAAATAQIGVATADLYPRIALNGTFSMQATKFAWMGNWDSHMFGLGPSIRWPIFEGGRIRANIRVQDARQEQALARYEQIVLDAVREVEDALITYTTERTRRGFLVDAVEASRQSVELAQLAYDQGATDLLAVLDAQRMLYAAQDALAEADQTVIRSLMALYKALGGGWDEPAMAPP